MSSRAKHDLHLSFQDKILHIAKVAEAAKTENLNLSESPSLPSILTSKYQCHPHHHVQRTSLPQILEPKTHEFRTSQTRWSRNPFKSGLMCLVMFPKSFLGVVIDKKNGEDLPFECVLILWVLKVLSCLISTKWSGARCQEEGPSTNWENYFDWKPHFSLF